jgi:hypothetical protein
MDMKKHLATSIQIILALLGLAVLFALIVMPLREGRAKNLDLLHIYMDGLIIYSYISSIVFFIGLYKCIQLIENIKQNRLYSTHTIELLHVVKTCSLLMMVFVALAGVYIRTQHHPSDDPAGFIGLCILAFLTCFAIFRIAIKFEKKIKHTTTLRYEANH